MVLQLIEFPYSRRTANSGRCAAVSFLSARGRIVRCRVVILHTLGLFNTLHHPNTLGRLNTVFTPGLLPAFRHPHPSTPTPLPPRHWCWNSQTAAFLRSRPPPEPLLPGVPPPPPPHTPLPRCRTCAGAGAGARRLPLLSYAPCRVAATAAGDDGTRTVRIAARSPWLDVGRRAVCSHLRLQADQLHAVPREQAWG